MRFKEKEYFEKKGVYVDILNEYKLSDQLTGKVEVILNKLDSNMNSLYEISREKLKYEKHVDQDIVEMRNAVDAIEDKVSIMKINADDEFLNKLVVNRSYNTESAFKKLQSDNYNIELMANIILNVGELRKDLNLISNNVDREKVLTTQQEFNHSLRKIIRVIVHNDRVEIRNNIGKYVKTIIDIGQDSPDLFDNKLKLIELLSNLERISQKNVQYLEDFNDAILFLSDSVQNNTFVSSDHLHNIVLRSAYILYTIAFLALFMSVIIIWKYIYKNIVLNLKNLSDITKKLSANDFNFTTNQSNNSDYEFRDIAIALNSLKEHSIKRIATNRQLARQSAKLKQSNEDLSQFAYIASHDLQEPLRMIGSYVQLLQKRYQGKIDDQAHQYINFVVDGCMRMKQLIEGLLEYSRVESNNDDIDDVNCNLIVNEVLHDLSIKVKETNADIMIDDLPSVTGIHEQIRIVFYNLINNALKYTDKSKPIVHIGSELCGDNVKFFIKDNGIGIKQQYQEKIFVIFKRLHSRSEYSGTGIGLSISKKIVERHGGEMTVTSSFGEGFVFYFALPVAGSSCDINSIAI